MIDNKQFELLTCLLNKYKEIHNKEAKVNIKMGTHPNNSAFILLLNDENLEMEFESFDDLLEALKYQCTIKDKICPFNIDETVWFLCPDNGISSFQIKEVFYDSSNKKFTYRDEMGDFLYSNVELFKTKNELIDSEIIKLEAQRD